MRLVYLNENTRSRPTTLGCELGHLGQNALDDIKSIVSTI
jgi:hypothetical protein